MKKRLLALGLTLVLLLGLLPGSALAAWESFRGSGSNMAITQALTPTEEDVQFLWANQLGSGYQKPVSVPILTEDALVCMAGTTLYKLDPATGEILAQAEMAAEAKYANAAPALAEGKLICALNGGVVQAFDAGTLESLWVYTDPLGGQNQVPVTCSGGYAYTGFWSSETGYDRDTGETKANNYVCLSIADEDPAQTNEAKAAKWVRPNVGGYYWAGAVVVGNAVIFGCDNGKSGSKAEETSQVVALDRETGEAISTLEGIPGDQRSSIAYCAEKGRVYFTTKTGYLCSAAVDGETGALSDLKTQDLGSATTATPVVYGGKVYLTAANKGFGASAVKQNFQVADADTLEVLYTLPMAAYPQSSLLLSTAYLESQGKLYFYSTYNAQPGGITLIKVDPDATTAEGGEVVELYDAAGYEQYCICSVICGADGTLYYKNDSGNMLAVGKKAAPVETMTVTVGAYDFNAGAAGLEGASETGTIFEETVTANVGTSAADVVLAAAQAAGKSVVIEEGAWGPYLTAVNGLTTGTGGGYSGWTMVYNDSFPSVGLGGLELQDGDTLSLHYSVNPDTLTDDVGSGEGLPILSSFTLGGVTVPMKKETTYDENWTATTKYLRQTGGDTWTELEGKGTQTEPFVIPVTLPAGTDLTALEGSYTTDLGEHYHTLTGLESPGDYTAARTFTLAARYGGEVTYYQVKATVLSGGSPSGGGSSTPRTISVSFTLLGDQVHNSDADGEVHTLKGGNLEEWVATTKVKVTANATVRTVLEKVLRSNGMTWVNEDGNYLESITRDGVTLGALTNGENSGWQYTLNGTHPSLGIRQQTLKDGDTIVLHYTDDYTRETDSGALTPSGGSSSGGTKDPKPTEPEAQEPDPQEPPKAAKVFADVPSNHWAKSAIDFVSAHGLFTGTSETDFSPAMTTTRGMVMTVLARLAGADTKGGKTWYEPGMDWAKAQGISDGTDPEGIITREQLATMLYRYAKGETGGKPEGFADAESVSDWAVDAMAWCVEKGIVTGKPGDRLDPQGTATRAEVAAVLERFVEREAK